MRLRSCQMLFFHSKWIHGGLAVCLLPEATGPHDTNWSPLPPCKQTSILGRLIGIPSVYSALQGINSDLESPFQCTSMQMNFILSLLLANKVTWISELCFLCRDIDVSLNLLTTGKFYYPSDIAVFWYMCIFIQERCLVLLVCGSLTVGSFIVMTLRRTITSWHFTGAQYHVLKLLNCKSHGFFMWFCYCLYLNMCKWYNSL